MANPEKQTFRKRESTAEKGVGIGIGLWGVVTRSFPGVLGGVLFFFLGKWRTPKENYGRA